MHSVCLFVCLWRNSPPVGQGFLIHEVSRSHTTTHPQSVKLLWTSDQPVSGTSTREHTTLTKNIHAPGGIRPHNLSRRAAAVFRRRPCGHCDRHTYACSSFSLCIEHVDRMQAKLCRSCPHNIKRLSRPPGTGRFMAQGNIGVIKYLLKKKITG
jgi:hypothetical protein